MKANSETSLVFQIWIQDTLLNANNITNLTSISFSYDVQFPLNLNEINLHLVILKRETYFSYSSFISPNKDSQVTYISKDQANNVVRTLVTDRLSIQNLGFRLGIIFESSKVHEITRIYYVN